MSLYLKAVVVPCCIQCLPLGLLRYCQWYISLMQVPFQGFVSLFDRAKKGDVDSFQIPAAELFRFSHIIPSFKMTGQERVGVPKGSFEFDPACLPAYIWKKADPEGIEGQP